MSGIDIEIVKQIGLQQKELSNFIGVSQQAFGQGLKMTRRYLDDARLVRIHKGLLDAGYSEKTKLLYPFVEDVAAFELSIKELMEPQGPLGTVAGCLNNSYVWFVLQRHRVNEEWPFINAFLEGQGQHCLLIATPFHRIAANSDWMAIRTFLESHYLRDFGQPESYKEHDRVIKIAQTALGLYTPEMLLPMVSKYQDEIGFVHTKNGFVELPSKMVCDMSFNANLDFAIIRPGKPTKTVIGGEQAQLVWTSSSLPYLKAMKVSIESKRSNIPDEHINNLWELLRNPEMYLSQDGRKADWQKIAQNLMASDKPVILDELVIDHQEDKRDEVNKALTWLEATGISKA